MTDEKQEQVERESFDLGEKPYRTIPPKGKPQSEWIERGRYKLFRSYSEDLKYLDEDKTKDPIFIQEGGLKLEKTWEENSRGFEFCEGGMRSSMYGAHFELKMYDFSDTQEIAKEFADKAQEYLKSKNLWVDSEKVAGFVYECFEPVRRRRKELSELVEGVDFGELESKE